MGIKHKIDDAIKIMARTHESDWEWYLSVLFDYELQETLEEIEEAKKTLCFYGITSEHVYKHVLRQSNKENEPIRFIDRHCFKAIETDELPF